MRFPDPYALKQQLYSGIVGFTGAAPQTVTGKSLDAGLASICLAAIVYAKATTNTLTLTAKWQVFTSPGGGIAPAWCDCVESNNPANVVLVTGTGSAVTVTKYISAPLGVVAGSKLARVIVTSGVGSGGGAGVDECSIAYDFRMPVNAYGS